jgi:hypothetical protein
MKLFPLYGVLAALGWSAFAMELPPLQGTITDAVTGEPLVAANVRVVGTTRGTITGSGGGYTLHLDPGTYTIVVSMIGYRSDTSRVTSGMRAEHNAHLTPADIVLPEMVISSEDPAVEIIRRAIANKRRWIDRLVSYQMEAFTRQVLRRDTAIASISESHTRGYWQQGDTLREVVLQKRQTANVKESFNFASVGQIINFSLDDIRFFGYTFVGPTSVEALGYYHYTLVRTRRDQGRDIYEIRMRPATRTVPLFDGTIHIADGSYALMGVDVEPNEAFLIPFVKDKQLRYRQQFALYDEQFWLPVDIRIDGYAKIGVAGFSFPRIGIEQASVITDYIINPQLPDSIFHKPRLVVDSNATRFDSTFWATHAAIPLSPLEKKAYASLDSTQTLEVQFRPGGIGARIGGNGGIAGNLLEIADVYFNRVEGLHLGASVDLKSLLPFAEFSAGFAYGFSDQVSSYHLGTKVFPFTDRILSIGIEGYHRLDHRPDQGFYPAFVNSFTALLNKNDYRDYFRAEGWQVDLTAATGRTFTATFSFINEVQSDAEQTTDFSFFYRSRSYRPNPSITEGKMRAVRLAVRFGEAPVPFGLLQPTALHLTMEHSNPSLASSDFQFTRYDVVGTLSIPTFARSYFISPTLLIRVAAGASDGTLPLQRAFDIETGSSGLGPFGVMRAMAVKEFGGNSYLAINAEHNFRSVPFLALGIPFLYENNIELILHGGVAQSWNTGHLPLQATDALYSEIGMGMSRIFDILRMDITWRLSSPRDFRFTLALAQLL